MSRFQRIPRAFCLGSALSMGLSVGSTCMGLATVAAVAPTPAYAMCDGMEMMPDGNFEFNPDLCRTASPNIRAIPQIWTAIAISKSNQRSATSWGASSKYAAEKAALNLCGTVNADCILAGARSNGCISVAVSLNHAWGNGLDISYIGADNQALANCAHWGGTNCVISAHPCSDDQPLNNRYTSLHR